MDSINIGLKSSDLKSLNSVIKDFNQHFNKAEHITLDIDPEIGHIGLHYFFTHIKFTWETFKDKVTLKCLEPEQIMIYAGNVFDHKTHLSFRKKIITSYIIGIILIISTVCYFSYNFFNNHIIKPLIQNIKENEQIKAETLPLIEYSLLNGWPTNRPWYEIVKKVRIASRIYNVPKLAIYSIMAQESEYFVYAVHTNTDYSIDRGLMQIDTCWNNMQVEDNIKVEDNIIYIPEYNIRAGTAILAMALKANNNDIIYALKRYNTCPTLVYSDSVINIYFQLSKLFQK